MYLGAQVDFQQIMWRHAPEHKEKTFNHKHNTRETQTKNTQENFHSTHTHLHI